MRGNILSMLALYGCIPGITALFTRVSPRIAVLVAMIGGVLFLPMDVVGWIPFIKYDKIAAVSIGTLAGVVLFDSERLESFSLHAVDIPMLLWCSSGFMAAMSNGLGIYDALSASSNTVLQWGVPYFLGRLYFSDRDGIKILAWGIVVGAVVYIPLVLFELRMSPQLHRIVYGYMQHDFSQVIRGGGYRPMVFMQHGIMLATWMCMAALTGLWCYFSGAFPRKVFNIPLLPVLLLLTMVAMLCKSTGAIGLLGVGFVTLLGASRSKMGLVLLIGLLLIPPLYIGARASGSWDGQNVVDFVANTISEDRAESLQFRLDNENILLDKALEKPLFGWGGWGRSRVYDPVTGEDISTTDGFWIISLGQKGYYGLFSVVLVLWLPMLLTLITSPPWRWKTAENAPVAVVSMIVLLFLVDGMLNCMINPVYILFAGAISGHFLHERSAKPLGSQEKVSAEDTFLQGAQAPVLSQQTAGIRFLGQGQTEVRQLTRRAKPLRMISQGDPQRIVPTASSPSPSGGKVRAEDKRAENGEKNGRPVIDTKASPRSLVDGGRSPRSLNPARALCRDEAIKA